MKIFETLYRINVNISLCKNGSEKLDVTLAQKDTLARSDNLAQSVTLERRHVSKD